MFHQHERLNWRWRAPTRDERAGPSGYALVRTSSVTAATSPPTRVVSSPTMAFCIALARTTISTRSQIFSCLALQP